MTRIMFIVNPEMMLLYIVDDPRSPRELVKLINTGEWVVGAGEVRMNGARQWARAHPPLRLVTVVLGEPPVHLTQRLYEVLFGIADGQKAEIIAKTLGISPSTVYEYTAELKERFGVQSREALVYRAVELGLLPIYPDGEG